MHKLPLGLLVALVAGAALPALAPAAPVTPGSRLTQNGIGSIRIGMTLDQARRRTGQTIDFTSFDANSTACGLGRLFPLSLGVTYLATDLHIAVLNVANPGISTRAGIEVGDTPADLRRAYRSRLSSQPNKYDPKARDYEVRFAHQRKLVFYVTAKGRIGQISGGRQPEIDYVEGCS
jgi:aryl carrier-like protein